MEPVELEAPDDGSWVSMVLAKDQPQYKPLPCLVERGTGLVYTKWSLSFEERQAILDGARIELFTYTFGRPLQPVQLRVEGTDESEAQKGEQR